MAFVSLPGASNPAEAKARAIKRDIADKVASRKFDAYCASAGIDPIRAQFLIPANAKRGQSLRRIEQRQRDREALKAEKERIKKKFQGRAS